MPQLTSKPRHAHPPCPVPPPEASNRPTGSSDMHEEALTMIDYRRSGFIMPPPLRSMVHLLAPQRPQPHRRSDSIRLLFGVHSCGRHPSFTPFLNEIAGQVYEALP
eukprot:gene8470-4831_t